ncbi:MAG: hypothetical protein OEZ51_10105 [Nitrospinota bacterium]|nr:hypothetical protein [Nitrospinota bacterium]
MQRVLILVLILFCVVISACSAPPFSKYPLSQPGKQPNDERLSEVWVYQENGRPIFVHISKEQEGWLEGVIVGPKDEGGLGLSTFQMLTTQIGQDHFMSIRNIRDFKKGATGVPGKLEPGEGFYWIFLYKIAEDGNLYLRMMDDQYVEESIKSGQVKGSIDKEGSIITLTDNSENLIRFVKDSDKDQLFPESQQIPDKNSFFKKLTVSSHPKAE